MTREQRLEIEMNPLSPFTYYRRHKRATLLLLVLIGLVTAGLYLAVALLWAISIEPMRSNQMYLSKFSIVYRGRESESDMAVVAQIRANPDVERAITATYGPGVQLPHVMGGGGNYWNFFALMEADVAYFLQRCGATLKEGQLLQPRTNGIMLSQKVAANLGLGVGDTIHNAIDPELYSNIPAPLEVVGILESDLRLSIASLEYFNDHELFSHLTMPLLLVMAQPGREAAVDDFLRNEIEAAGTGVDTFQELAERMARDYRATYALLLPVVIIVTVATLFVIGVANRSAFTHRVPEFGILHAAGHSKRWLIRRLALETGMLAVTGWVMGIGLSWLVLYVLRLALFSPRGHDLNVVTLAPAVPVIPVPIAVIGFTLVSAGRIFSRLDPVAIVERGELTPEAPPRRAATKSSSYPLASRTFYRRHKQRAVLSIGAMALMIIAVVMFIFLTTATRDARKASLEHLRRVSIVGLRIGSVPNPGVAAQLRTHPAVERVIPFAQFTMLNVFIPPGENAPINPFGVYAEDMAYLVELYGLQLKEGHLPRPRTNELIIPEVVAQNRDLQIGDVIGDPDHPAYPGASIRVPTPFVISGIFARPSTPAEENWLSFISLEFLESHEAFSIRNNAVYSLIVAPKAGQKAALDDWLEHELASSEVRVRTYRQLVASAQERSRTQILTIALLESVIAIVAATALAVLNYISVSERQAEFGVLHALGYGRLRLVWRTVRETLFTTGVAWGLSAVLFLIGLLYLQYGVFKPLGLRLDFFNPTPWLFTLPIPVAVLAVTTGTTARTLSKLDPVSIIERR
jgi:ABC-type lipoprotein release transport system permease subunit